MSHCHTIIDKLHRLGYRITPQREMIIEIMAHSQRHMTAEEIHASLREQTSTINLATVYRTLDMLWEEGFVRRNDFGEGKIYYATFKHGPHIHLVCRQCNRVIDADPDMLDPIGGQLLTKYEFNADLQHLSIYGLCADCSEVHEEEN